MLDFLCMIILRNIVLNSVHFSEVLVLLHNNNIVQKLNWENVHFFEDDEGIYVGLVLMLLLSCVQFTGRGAIPCIGAVGLSAVVLLVGETGIQAHKAFFKSLKTCLLFSANLAALIKDMSSLINLALLVCGHKW